MEKELIHILNNPLSVAQEHLFMIEDALEKYPYFQPLYLLKLKAVQNSNEQIQKESLEKAAIFTSNRKIIFDYLGQEFVESQQNWEIEENPEIELSNLKEETIADAEIQPDENELEKTENESIEILKEIEGNEDEATSEKNETEILKEKSLHSFNEWLNINKNLGQDSTLPTVSTENSVQDKFKIIEEFLDKNPKITPPKEFKQNISIPAQKTNMSHLMTETLAQIYVEQNKYDKAIKAYSILRLKYPEKSGYFADRINEINELKNNRI